MSHGHNGDLELDALIDDVARAMTGGLPASDLKARVTARIAGDDASSVRGRRLAWVLAPAAAAAVLVLAVFVLRETRPRSPQARQPSVRSEPASQEPNAVSGAATTVDIRRDAGAGIIHRTDASTATRRATPPPPDSDLAPLTLAPLEVDRLEVSPIARSEAIVISPMAIERIEIAPMP
jgi:hypothetical protein